MLKIKVIHEEGKKTLKNFEELGKWIFENYSSIKIISIKIDSFEITEEIEKQIEEKEPAKAISYLVKRYNISKNIAETNYNEWRKGYKNRKAKHTVIDTKAVRSYSRWNISEERKEKIIKMRKDGLSVSQIANKEKIHKDKVYKMLKGIYPDSWNGECRRGRR